MKTMINSIIEKIKLYIYEEENVQNDLLRPQGQPKATKVNMDELSLDDLFGSDFLDDKKDKSSFPKKSKYEGKEIDFWNQNKLELLKMLDPKYRLGEEFWVIKDVMNILRGKYFFNDSYQTIDKSYQEMCNFFIRLQLKKNDIGIDNFLRYFDPESGFFKRVKALTLFRLLKNPRKEIGEVCGEVSNLLYDGIANEPDSFDKSLNILKEYIDRAFSIKYRSFESRQIFISTKWSDSWEILRTLPAFQNWISAYISDEEKLIIKQEQEEIIESVDNKSEEKETAKQEEKDRIKELEAKIAEMTASFNETLKKKDEEYSTLSAKLELVKQSSEVATQKKEEKKESDEDILERRSTYKILVVGGREKNNKKYNYDLKNEFDGDLYKDYGIHPNQLGELYGDYEKQSKQKDFAKKIENDLLLGNINFIIVLQNDHETDLYNKIINNSDFGSRVTCFAEREENNANPKYSDQKYSKDRFLYYIGRALEKYETAEMNNDI